MKDMMAGSLRAFLHVVGVLDIGDEAEVAREERELAGTQKSVDTLVLIHRGDTVVHQFEFLAWWHGREREAMLARLETLLDNLEFKEKRVRMVVILMTPNDVPRQLPERLEDHRGWSGAWTSPLYIKSYELDPWVALDLGVPGILPLVPLMKPDPVALERAASIVASDERLRAQFVILGSMVYDVDEMREMVGRRKDMPLWDSPEVLANTPLGQRIVEYGAGKAREEGRQEGLERGREEGLQKGLEQGKEQGRRESALSTIRKCLARRFPKLLDAPELGTITSPDQAEAILEALIDSQDEQAAIRALRSDSV
jgi:hypothetical protein